jgi:hypothetical protein
MLQTNVSTALTFYGFLPVFQSDNTRTAVVLIFRLYYFSRRYDGGGPVHVGLTSVSVSFFSPRPDSTLHVSG